jgi:hypothetical protein
VIWKKIEQIKFFEIEDSRLVNFTVEKKKKSFFGLKKVTKICGIKH